MVKLHTIGQAQIRVYARDHRPAHFHVVTPETEAMIEIATVSLLRGSLPAGLHRAIEAWAAANQAFLVAEWNRLNPTCPCEEPIVSTTIPRIARVDAEVPSTLHVRWQDHHEAVTIDLAGWIERGGALFAPLLEPAVFARATIAAFGSAVTWDDDEGDLAIDAAHLALLAEAQRPFGPGDAARWQEAVGLSNQYAAKVLGVGLATWKRFKAGTAVPATVARLCRAAERDPVIVEAYRGRRVSGRPRKAGIGRNGV